MTWPGQEMADDEAWYAIAGPAGLALLAPGFPAMSAFTCWRLLRGQVRLSSLLGELTSGYGTQLGTVPAFALALRAPDGWRLALRSPAEAKADGVIFDGREAATWHEHGPMAITELTLRRAGATGPAAPCAPTGLADGICRADAVSWPAPASLPELDDKYAETEYPDAMTGDEPGGDAVPGAVAGPRAAQPPDAGRHDTGPPDAGPHDAVPGGWDAALTAASESSAQDAMPGDASSPERAGAPIGAGQEPGPAWGRSAALGGPARGLPAPGPGSGTGSPLRSRGRIRISTGERYELDGSLIIGRRPRSTRSGGSTPPRLIAVPSPSRDVSRSHLQFLVADDGVLAADLNATNGTMLERKGQPLRRLQSREVVAPRAGDVFHLGDGITVLVEEVR